MLDLTNSIYADANKAREHLETLHWPNGPICPHCGNADPTRIRLMVGKSTRPGVRQCNECRKPFTVTVGTIFEDSKIPLNKWLLAVHLLSAGKKGTSAHQMHRMLGVTYKTAWFMAHRVREAMTASGVMGTDGLGGAHKPVEVDETYIGGKAKNRAHGQPQPKKAVVSLIEREGRVRSFYVANVTAKTVRPIIVRNVDRASVLMTDETPIYKSVGREFDGHYTVNHSANEYARLGGYVHTNTAENFYSILKRGIEGIYHHVSEAHLHRYLAEFDFRYNNRSKLGVEDAARAAKIIEGARGKRITYRSPSSAANH